jgi:hypothetical protein
MSDDDPRSRTFSLRRWSRRKLAAARAAPEPVPGPGVAPATGPLRPANGAAPVAEPAAESVTLPPIETLTIDSDFTAFLQPRVAETIKRQALKQLFRDPRFNVMDGLDVYVGDYSQPDPISPEVVKGLMQARYVFDPPQTRVNQSGVVEDVPAAEAAVADESGPVSLPESTPPASGDVPVDVVAPATPSAAVASLPSESSDPAPR